MSETAFIADPPPVRRSAAQPPLGVWLCTVLVCLVCAAGLSGWFVFGSAPVPVAADAPAFQAQLAALDRQVADYARLGQKPLKVVFLGTSRFRSIALDSAEVARSARAAGLTRPVASTVIGVNMGGFERIMPILKDITARKPDLVVVMPELLMDDFNPLTRAWMGKLWLQDTLWGKDYQLFGKGEMAAKVCTWFAQSAAGRNAEYRSFLAPDPNGKGPTAARAFLAALARSGTHVVVTDVPVTADLAALRPRLPQGAALLPALGLGGLPNTSAIIMGNRFPRSVYCDYAHMNPAKAVIWQMAFFTALVADPQNRFGH